MLGKPCHISAVVPGKTYSGSLYGSLKWILSSQKGQKRRISREAHEDLENWMQFLESIPSCRPFHMLVPSVPVISIYTDSSKNTGFDAVCESGWFDGLWPSADWKRVNIAILELYPVYVALYIWTEDFYNNTIAVHSHNKAVVQVLNKLYAKDKGLRLFLKPAALWCMQRNLVKKAFHIDGEKNIGPDLLSSDKVDEFLRWFPHMQRDPTALPTRFTPESHNVTQL